MTDSTPPLYAAQLLLSLPDQSQSAQITITLLPDDTIPVEGRKKALADCTLRELRTFANTLEAEIWQTYDEISVLDLSTTKDVAVAVSLLDETGKATQKLEDWDSSIVVLPASAPKAKTAAPAKSAARAPKPPKAGEKAPTSEAPPAPPTQPAAEKQPEPPAQATTPPPAAAPPATKPAPPKPDDLDDVASAIAFPAPVKQKDIEDARPKATDRPEAPATIKPSQARVRVAGKQLAAGAPTSAAVDILMDEPALRAMQAHALSSLDREVAGVMVGPRPEKQPDGRYVVRVIDSIAAKYTVMQGASVTYTADSWRYLNDTIEERYPNETGVMVGWYHTHPGFGIFLSGMDLFIHQNFFTQIWHTAYVLDPRARTSGFFCWSRDKSRVSKYDFAWPDWADGSW